MPTDTFASFFRRPSQRSFQALVRAEQGRVTSTAWRVLGDRGLAEDVTQELFMAVLKHSSKRKTHEGRAKWLSKTIGLARTRLRSERRRQAREHRAAEEHENLVHSGAEQTAVLLEVREAVGELPDDWRQCTELRYFAGLSSEEIASELKLSRRSVDERLGKARGRLESKLSALGAAAFASPPNMTPSGLAITKIVGSADSLPALTATAKSVVCVGALLSVLSAYWIGTTLVSARDHEETIGAIAASQEVETPRATLAQSMETPERLTPPKETASTKREVNASAPIEAPLDSAIDTELKQLSVRVVDERGEPVSGATLSFGAGSLDTVVILAGLDGTVEPYASLLEPIALGTESEWSISGLPAVLTDLDYVLDAYIEEQGSAESMRFSFGEGARTDLVIVCPRPRRVQVTCSNAATGEAILDAIVTMKTEAQRRGPGFTRASVPVDENGVAHLNWLGAGAQELLVQAPGYVPQETTLQAGNLNELAVDLSPLESQASLRVQAIGPLGQALAGATVTVEHCSTDARYWKKTDAFGEAVFEDLVPLEEYSAELSLEEIIPIFRGVSGAEDRWTAQTVWIELKAGDHNSVTIGELIGEARRAFQFVDAAGSVLTDVEYDLYGPVGKSVEADENGWVVLNKIPVGNWTIDYGHGRSHSFEIAEGDDSNLEERIVLGDASIAGVVHGPEGEPFPGALIILVGSQGDMTRTDENGRFLVEHLPRGESYEVHAHHPDHEDQKVSTLTDAKGAEVTVELRFP